MDNPDDDSDWVLKKSSVNRRIDADAAVINTKKKKSPETAEAPGEYH